MSSLAREKRENSPFPEHHDSAFVKICSRHFFTSAALISATRPADFARERAIAKVTIVFCVLLRRTIEMIINYLFMTADCDFTRRKQKKNEKISGD